MWSIKKLFAGAEPEKGKEEMKERIKEETVFNLTDGKRPTRAHRGSAYTLRAPFDINIAPLSTSVIDVGVSCRFPVLLFAPYHLVSGKDLELVTSGIIDSDTGIVVRIRNNTSVSQTIGEGEALARFTLQTSGVEVV